MFGLYLIILVMGVIIFMKPESFSDLDNLPANFNEKMNKLWDVAQEAIIDKKYDIDEKVLLTILQFDEKNATAYNRLGIIYTSQKKYDEAIECFEIAQSLESSASSLHNVWLIYLETKNYQKAALAFEQALKLEDNLATRHIAYSKALENLGKHKLAAIALEKAYQIDERPQTLRSLGAAYYKAGNMKKAKEVKQKLDDVKGNHKKIKQNRKSSSIGNGKKINM